MLLDAWAARHLGAPYDGNGRWAAAGTVIDALLAAMIADPFFDRTPPKSTGRDDFNDAWLGRFAPGTYAPQDVQATLTALTATTIARAVERYCDGADELLVCGGGAHNATLLRTLAARLPGTRVATTDLRRHRSRLGGGDGVRMARAAGDPRRVRQPAGGHRRARPARARRHLPRVAGSRHG